MISHITILQHRGAQDLCISLDVSQLVEAAKCALYTDLDEKTRSAPMTSSVILSVSCKVYKSDLITDIKNLKKTFNAQILVMSSIHE
jgi:hypothetical protein